MRLPSLSVVVPVYNEPVWIGPTVAAIEAAIRASDFDEAEIVIVDDGSDEPTQDALAALRTSVPLRVVRRPNGGRFAARRTGVEAARHDLVLLVDARVTLEPDALAFVASCIREDPERTAWNGHVEIDVHRNPFARFWRVLNRAAFSAYLADPRTTSFGLEEYDAFPKGTGCFVAPRRELLEAIKEFRSLYSEEDLRHANDDTVLIRSIAARRRIHISPNFACVYHARTELKGFMRHAYHRGTVFVDAFARPETRFFPIFVGFFPAALGFVIVSLRRPMLGVGALAAIPFIAGSAALGLRADRRDALAFGVLSVPFGLPYSAGIVRGAALLVRNRFSSR